MNRVLVALPFVLSCLIACSSTTGATDSGGTSSGGTGAGSGATCGKSGRSGETIGSSCGTCAAGQYCNTDGFNECKPGCTSDANCGESEQCIRCGTESVGTCQSCSRDAKDACTTTPPPPLPGEPDAGPEDICMRDTALDFMCGPTLTKAYECFGQEPVQAGCEHGMGSPTVFCCPK